MAKVLAARVQGIGFNNNDATTLNVYVDARVADSAGEPITDNVPVVLALLDEGGRKGITVLHDEIVAACRAWFFDNYSFPVDGYDAVYLISGFTSIS